MAASASTQPLDQPPDTIRFYFSFRSPYTWLALHRIDTALAGRGLTLEYIPVFPPPNFANNPTKIPNKLVYIGHDVSRIAEAYGLPSKMPAAFDCDWVRPHAAFLYASDQGKGPEFAKAIFSARFGYGKDIGSDDVIAECASAVGLAEQPTLAAQGDVKLQERVVLGMIRGATEDQLFGVPLFVYRGERFWGNDRIEWLLRSIDKSRGVATPELQDALLSPVHR